METVVKLESQKSVELVKIGKHFIVGFFSVTALSDFVLKKRLNYVDVLPYGDHRRARIMYKWLRVINKVDLYQSSSRRF